MGRGVPQAACFQAERLPEVGEGAAQTGEGLFVGTFGPEGSGEPVTPDFTAMAEREESKQPPAFAGAKTRQGLAADPNVERPE